MKKTSSDAKKSKTVHSGGRREVIIVAVFAVVIVGVIAVAAFLNREHHYNGDNVTLDFSPDAVADIPVDAYGDSGEFGDFTGADADNVGDLPEDAVMFDSENTTGATAPSVPEANSDYALILENFYIEDGTLYDVTGSAYGSSLPYTFPTGETIDKDGVVRSAEGAVVGEIDIFGGGGAVTERLTAEQYATMLVHYVCGIEDSLFSSYLSPDLQAAFDQYSSVEPYATLRGTDNFKLGAILDNEFSFTVGPTQYTFEVSFLNDTVIGIRYKQ